MDPLQLRWKIDGDVHFGENVMTYTTPLSYDEGLQVLHSNLAELDSVLGSFILGVNDQVGTPLCF